MASDVRRAGCGAIRRGSLFTIRHPLEVGELDHRQPVRQLQRRLETLGEPRGHVGPHDDAVDHDLNIVLQLLVERRRIGDLVELRRRF